MTRLGDPSCILRFLFLIKVLRVQKASHLTQRHILVVLSLSRTPTCPAARMLPTTTPPLSAYYSWYYFHKNVSLASVLCNIDIPSGGKWGSCAGKKGFSENKLLLHVFNCSLLNVSIIEGSFFAVVFHMGCLGIC